MSDNNLNEIKKTALEAAENAEEAVEETAAEEVVEEVATEEATEETAENKKTDKKSVKDLVTKLKSLKSKKLKNELLFKKGSYSMAITALVLVAVLLVNWLIGALSNRFNLEFDMTLDKNNTLSEENIDYVKNIENEVSIIFCANEEDYPSNISSMASYYYQVSDQNAESYYKQTVNIVKKYADYNKKIKLEFIDTQTTEFSAVTAKYPTDNISYGDIIVSATVKGKDGNSVERHKMISYNDIYNLADETGYAAMGYGGYTIGGNNIETKLTSAIAFVQSAETKKVALVTGHSTHTYAESYRELLEANNYEVSIIEDSILTELSDEYDIVALVAPNTDFLGSELDVISAFLDNGDKLGKGLMFFADATVPALENLNGFLLEWGIELGDAILYETDPYKQIQSDPFSLRIVPTDDEINKGLSECVTGYNVPMIATEAASDDISVTEIMTTYETAVEAPRGVTAGWKEYTEEDYGQYAGIIQAEKVAYDTEGKETSSFVMSFASVEYFYSEWANYKNLSNKDIVIAVTDRAANVGDTGISFVYKTIVSESFADTVTTSDIAVVRTLFVILLPIASIVMGIVIFFRRKNA